MADPSNIFAIDDLTRVTGLRIEVVIASDAAITAALTRATDVAKGWEQ